MQTILGESLLRPRNINHQGPSIHFTRPCSILRAGRLQHRRPSLTPKFNSSISHNRPPILLQKRFLVQRTRRALLHNRSGPAVYLHPHFVRWSSSSYRSSKKRHVDIRLLFPAATRRLHFFKCTVGHTHRIVTRNPCQYHTLWDYCPSACSH